jgi:hypothetical protein
MRYRLWVLALSALASTTAAAQDQGGLKLDKGVIDNPDAQAAAIQNTLRLQMLAPGRVQGGPPDANQGDALSRSQKNQQGISKLRGDSGFLGGFQFGQPTQQSGIDRLAKPPAPADQGVFDPAAVTVEKTVNVFRGPVSVIEGDNNVVQQQVSPGTGPAAQQQIVTKGGGATTKGGKGGGTTSGGGNSNVAAGAGATAQQQVVTVGDTGGKAPKRQRRQNPP